MGTVHLGSLGTPRKAVEIDFDYFGETIRVHPEASELQFAELMFKAKTIDLDGLDANDPSTWDTQTQKAALEASSAVLDSITQQIHPDDWDRFWETAKRNRQGLVDLMVLSNTVTQAVVEASTDFPTGRSSASPTGRSTTGRKSKAASGSRGTGRGSRDTAAALRLLRGRPDLQAGVLRAEQALSEAG